jgi:hypothetical protein
MAWSIFKQGGGKGVAVTWANDLLDAIGAPKTPGNVQVVYDWEVSEGGGGKYNPLNQGPVPGHSELTTTGSQYGGGAADYASWQAGITGAADYLSMSNFQAIKRSLVAGDSVSARNAIINSPWAASHYGHGSAFSNAAPPGASGSLPGLDNSGGTTNATNAGLSTTLGETFLNSLLSGLGLPDLKDMAERTGLIIMGTILIIVGIVEITGARQKSIEISKEFVGGKAKVAKAATGVES